MNLYPLTATVVILLCPAGRAPAEEQAGKDPSRFKITLRRKDDTCTQSRTVGKVLLEIRSPFGISQAVVERLEEQWPKDVIVRLHLKGLSNFRAANGTTTLHAATDAGGKEWNVRQWRDGKETPGLDRTSPFWMTIRREAGVPPGTDSFFEITLPRPFLAGNPKSIQLNWIDFYR